MDLVAAIAEHNSSHPQWEERVQFFRDFFRMSEEVVLLKERKRSAGGVVWSWLTDRPTDIQPNNNRY